MIHSQVYQKTLDSMLTSEFMDGTMLYQRSLEIEQRLESVLQIIGRGGYSAPLIANELGVSVPTISRAVCALRERGNRIRAEKQADGWCYRLVESE